MKGITAGFALCGSFCTIKKAVAQLKVLNSSGVDIVPIMSPIVYTSNTRFGTAKELIDEIESLTNKKIITTVVDAEPIGPKKLLDLMIIAPCTGNTLSKLANGITDNSVTMAAKAHLRNGRPLLLAIATNDGLSACGNNIGRLMNTKNIYFVPFGQDDAFGKPTSLIADFDILPQAAEAALKGEQLQPILIKD